MNKIKILILLSFSFALTLSPACSKLLETIDFGFNIRGDFPVPPSIPANIPFELPTLPVSHNMSKEFEDNGTKAELVKEIRIEYLKLKVEEPIGGDLSFLKDIEIRLNKDGVGEKLVAWKYDVDDAVGQELALEVTPDVLDAYLKSDNFEMKIKVTTDKVNSKQYKISYDIRTKVKANLPD
ncbi:MAG: hypothetical protein EP332_04220 [Bacteroidetes bacterium]|nr:MAG: hypothetical protein EP332_04220 [Bacteroidota bacterium]